MPKYIRVLLVGGCGFIGRNLMNKLITHGFSVSCYDRIQPDWLPDEVRFFQGDFSTGEGLESAVAETDVIVHLVSTVLPKKSNENPLYDIDTNLKSSVELLRLSVEYHVKRFVFISSGGTVYGKPLHMPIHETHDTNPLCSYGIVKLAIEKYIRLYEHLYGLSGCSLRLANPYGSYQRYDTGQGVIATFCHKALLDEQIEIWGDGSVARDFIHIDDVTEAIWRAITNDEVYGELNIGSGISTTLNHVIACIEELTGRTLDCAYREGRSFDVHDSWLDISKARTELGWEPKVSLAVGVGKTLEWQRQQVIRSIT